MKKLENNVLEGVNIGDNLFLKTENGDFVSGFVVKSTIGKVRLSHEHPKNNESYNFTKGNRDYWLSKFSEYEVRNLPNNEKQNQ